MELRIDGRKVFAIAGEDLREMVVRLGLDCASLSERPLAAKIAGEVFTLNYVPVRNREMSPPDRVSIRRAMEASGGEIRLLRYRDEAGKEAYIRTAQFVIFLAMRQLWPEAAAKMNCTLGSSVYIQVKDAVNFSVMELKRKIQEYLYLQESRRKELLRKPAYQCRERK